MAVGNATAEALARIYVIKGQDVHQRLAAALMLKLSSEIIDNILAKCPLAECDFCSTLICPHACAMHFHHDGCPCCDNPYHFEENEHFYDAKS